MSYDDWFENFERCEICNLTPTNDNVTLNGLSKKVKKYIYFKKIIQKNNHLICPIKLKNICSIWDEKIFYGKWISVESNVDDSVTSEFSFHVQQFSVTCSVLIGLMQKCEKRRELDSIKFKLFRIKGSKLNSNAKKIKSKYLELVDSFGYFESKFEVTKMLDLKKGDYVVIPERNGKMNKEFIVRVYTEKSSNKKY